jgi:hypothetical protein
MAYLYPLVVVWVVFRVLGLLIHQRCRDRAVGSGGFLLFCAFFSLILCDMMPFFVVGVLSTLEM